MYIRCSRCHEPTRIRSLVPGLVDRSVECQDCGHEHDLSRSDELGETGKAQYEIANEFATRNSVDLPTAYSILLGLMTLQEARDANAAQKETQRKKAAPAKTFEPSADSLALAEDTLAPAEDALAPARDAPAPEEDELALAMDAAAQAVDATAQAVDAPAPAAPLNREE